MSVGGQFVRDLRTVLQGQDFRRLFRTRLAGQSADGGLEAALAGLFFFSPQRATTAAGIAFALTAATLPYTLIGPFAGVLLDRWRRRQILLWANLIRAGLVVVIVALVASGAVGLPVYIAVLGCLSVNRFVLSGLSAGLPHVVVPDELVMANAVSTTSGAIAAMFGGGVALGIRTLLGAGDRTDAVLLAGVALTYVIAGWSATRMDRDLLGPDPDHRPDWHDLRATVRSIAHGLGDAATHLRARPRSASALAVLAGQRFAYGLVTVAIFLMCRNTFADPADPEAGALKLATVFAASGGGFFLGAVVTPAITRRMARSRWILICTGLASAVGAVFAFTPTYPVTLACGFAVAFALQGTKICVDSLIQREVADEVLGRVMSLYDMAFNATFVAAAAVCAAVLPASGVSKPLFALVAAVFALLAIGYARYQRGLALRAIYRNS